MRPGIDLAVCAGWRRSIAVGQARVGIVPRWNAATLLNDTAAAIWDLLVETQDPPMVAARYARAHPDRCHVAAGDVAACIAAWDRQGLFCPPEPSSEQRRLAEIADHLALPTGSVSFRRRFLVAGRPVCLDVENAALGRVVEDLLVDFPGADADAGADTQADTHADKAQPTPVCHFRMTGPRGGWVLWKDGRPLRLADSLTAARGQIVAELVRLAGGAAGWLATIHGAALSGPDGAVFLTGASGAGKSTLSAGLTARGWRLMAEDIAAFDTEMAITPLPFALSIKAGAVAALLREYPGLATARVHPLGPRRIRYQSLVASGRAMVPERPRLILDVCFRRDLGDAPADLTPLTPVETLGLFMNEESHIDFTRADADGFFDFVAHTPAFRLRYGQIDAAAQAIRSQLVGRPRDTPRSPARGAGPAMEVKPPP